MFDAFDVFDGLVESVLDEAVDGDFGQIEPDDRPADGRQINRLGARARSDETSSIALSLQLATNPRSIAVRRSAGFLILPMAS